MNDKINKLTKEENEKKYRTIKHPYLIFFIIGQVIISSGVYFLRMYEDPVYLLLIGLGFIWFILGWIIYRILLNAFGFDFESNQKITFQTKTDKIILFFIVGFIMIGCNIFFYSADSSTNGKGRYIDKYTLGVMFYKDYKKELNKNNIEKAQINLKKSIENFELAHRRGNVNASLTLGVIYLKGIGVEKSSEKAYKYLKTTASNYRKDKALFKKTIYPLSNLYLNNYFVKNITQTQRNLGYMLFYGLEGMPKNQEEGFYWLEQAAKNYDIQALKWRAFVSPEYQKIIFENIKIIEKDNENFKQPRERIENTKMWEHIYHWFLRLEQTEMIFQSKDWGWIES